MKGNKTSGICLIIFIAIVFMTGCISQNNRFAAETKAITNESMDKDMIQDDLPEDQGFKENQGMEKRIEAFAEMVQEAVADKNLESLADLLFYPCDFITADLETVVLEKREDILTMNPDTVFGDALMVSVANVDTGAIEIGEKNRIQGENESGITFQIDQDGRIGIIEIKE